MRFLVAPDSFKGSLTSAEAGTIIRSAILAEMPDATVRVVPMADGGEGTVEALVTATNGTRIEHEATGPLGEKITTCYGVLGDGQTAVIEVAATAGLILVPKESRNPLKTTSRGVGESIMHALDHGVLTFIIGLGGSATNDGGMGLLEALGVRFLDDQKRAVASFGANLAAVRSVDYSEVTARLAGVIIRGACDVDNPLCGQQGASFTYGPQKGATPADVLQLDNAMAQYAGIVEAHLGHSFQNVKGAGAAGGIGFALLTLGAQLTSGARLVCEAARVDRTLADTDWLITGEGKTDAQTLHGKMPFYLSSLARKHNVPVILISGSIPDDLSAFRPYFQSMHSTSVGPITIEEAMAKAKPLLYNKTLDIVRLLKEKKLR
jgi:glycerate 2-kinase